MYNGLKEILDKLAPIKTKRVTIREDHPWYNAMLKDIKVQKRLLEKFWLDSRDDNDI